MLRIIPMPGDKVAVGNPRNPRIGKVTKVLEPKQFPGILRSPGGYVVDNDAHTFWVAPWERIEIIHTEPSHT